MPKLRLDLHALTVETFSPAPDEAAGRGTVLGQALSDACVQTAKGCTLLQTCDTCDGWSCPRTCDASCLTCDASCDMQPTCRPACI